MGNVSKFVFWGRGGEGSKTASHILAQAAFYENKEVQAFPEYGPERSGAPMRTYVKISDCQIKDSATIQDADYIIFIDGQLALQPDLQQNIFGQVKKETVFLINSKDQVQITYENQNYKTYSIDASEIARKNLGKDLPNVVLLGALVKITKIVDIKDIEKAIEEVFKSKKEALRQNIDALREAYSKV